MVPPGSDESGLLVPGDDVVRFERTEMGLIQADVDGLAEFVVDIGIGRLRVSQHACELAEGPVLVGDGADDALASFVLEDAEQVGSIDGFGVGSVGIGRITNVGGVLRTQWS